MNFLAHLYLSFNNEDIIIGNFIADAVKGNSLGHFPPGVARGIRLHREIDHFTDNHPVFKQSRDRILPVYGKFSGIVIDIYYDHFLARNWKDYSSADLGDYVNRAYGLLVSRYSVLPGRSRRILPFMIAQNWLVGYADFKSLQRVFNGMSRRTRYLSGMENAITDLKNSYGLFESEFRLFFPELIRHAENHFKTLNNINGE